MPSIIYDKFGQPHKASDLNIAYEIFRIKEKSGSNPWPVIEKIINIWITKNPIKWDSYLTYLKETKETRKVTTVGGSLWRGVSRGDRENDAITVYAVDIPQPVMFMIRAVYSHKELPMNKEFFREFAKHFPQFRIVEKR